MSNCIMINWLRFLGAIDAYLKSNYAKHYKFTVWINGASITLELLWMHFFHTNSFSPKLKWLFGWVYKPYQIVCNIWIDALIFRTRAHLVRRCRVYKRGLWDCSGIRSNHGQTTSRETTHDICKCFLYVLSQNIYFNETV